MEDPGVGGRMMMMMMIIIIMMMMMMMMIIIIIIIIISYVFRKWDGGGAWTELIWLSVGTIGRLL